MEYRRKQYSVVQGLEGGLWKWSVNFDGHGKSGKSPSRPAGIKAAEHEIDRALAPKKRRLCRPGSKV
jgi:hypothetical protein